MEKGSGDEDIIKVNQSSLSKTEVNVVHAASGAAGAIHKGRYHSYLKLRAELEEAYALY